MALNQTLEDDQTLTYKKTDDGRFQCLVCPHRCTLWNGQIGVCNVREAKDNQIVLNAYGKISHAAIEPIEKKPIYHYKPNLKVLSTGGLGCSMKCDYCENWAVSQTGENDSAKTLYPNDIVSLALKNDCEAVCFTYNEPIVYFEYIVDLAKKCKTVDLDLLLKTNGYAKIPVWDKLCSITSAMNIDWKGNQSRYREIAKADEGPVLECIERAIPKTHVEISIPIYYDATVQEHEEFSRFIGRYSYVPVHLLKIYPAHKMKTFQVTSDKIIHNIAELYRKRSSHVYLHGVYSEKGLQDTSCPFCKSPIAERESLSTILHKESCCGVTIIKK